MQVTPVRECQDGTIQADTPSFKNYTAKTASYTLTAADNGKAFGAGAAATFTLPAAKIGRNYLILKTTNHTITLTATGGAKIDAGSANGSLANSTSGDVDKGFIHVGSIDGTNWHVLAIRGTWA